jgi:hypothetical protein
MRTLHRFAAELAVWLLPLIVVAEYVGTTFGNTVAATIALYALFLAILWIAPPEPADATPRFVWFARAFGLLCLVVGAVGMQQALAPVLDPVHNPAPNLANPRVRELYLYLPTLFAYPLAFSFRLFRGRSSGRDYERLGIFIALGLLAHMVGKLRVQGLPVLPYGHAGLAAALVTAEITLIAVAFVPRVPSIVRLGAVLGAGLGLRYVGLSTWQLDPATRDMLPLVKSAQDALLAGHAPYALHQMQFHSVVPLTYLPGMWLSYGLPRLFGGDLRILGLIADAAVVGGLYWAASGVTERFRARAQGIALGFGAVWLFSPSLHWNGIYAEPHAWWLWLALLLAAALRRRWWLAAAALGVALATRHFAIVVAPFVLLAMLRDLGWRAALPRVAVTGVVTAALYLPFVLADPESFWFGTYRWLVEYGPVHQSWFWEKFGFSGPLYQAHLAEWIPRAQAVAALPFFVVALFLRGRRRLIAPLGSAYVLFVMFNGIIWDSFYLGCALFAAFAAAGGHEQRSNRAPAPGIFWLGAAGTAAAAVAAGILVVTLVRAESRAGASAARALLDQNIAQGDVLVERSDWDVAFVRGEPLMAGRTPALMARDVFDARLGVSGAFGQRRAWFAFRVDRDKREQSALGIAGRRFEDHVFGRYRVFGLEPLQSVNRLSASPSGAPVRPCRIGGEMRPLLATLPTRRAPIALNWSGALLARSLVVVAGAEDSGMVWGHEPVTVALAIDGRAAGGLDVPNLPGLHFFAVDTAALSGAHDVALTITTRDETGRGFCVDGWMLGG